MLEHILLLDNTSEESVRRRTKHKKSSNITVYTYKGCERGGHTQTKAIPDHYYVRP